jgi:hypothetical protein
VVYDPFVNFIGYLLRFFSTICAWMLSPVPHRPGLWGFLLPGGVSINGR